MKIGVIGVGAMGGTLAGDDVRAKQIAMELVNGAGFDPVDGGSLEESWRQQPSTPAYCCDYGAAKTREGIRAAVKGKAEQIRDHQWREGYGRLYANKPTHAAAHAAVIAMNRALNPLQGHRRQVARTRRKAEPGKRGTGVPCSIDVAAGMSAFPGGGGS